jgi:hypothetical protein
MKAREHGSREAKCEMDEPEFVRSSNESTRRMIIGQSGMTHSRIADSAESRPGCCCSNAPAMPEASGHLPLL